MVVTDHGPIQTWYLGQKDVPARVTFDRETVSRSPHFFPQEHRFVELHEPTRGRQDLSPREHRRSSRSANPPRRAMVVSQKDRSRRDSSESDSDSDSDTDGSSPRRVRSRRHYDRYLPLTPAGPVYADPRNHPRSIGIPRSLSQGPRGPPRRYDSGSDSSSDDDDHDGGKKNAQPQPPPKHILYTGLACVATLAAANNIYQSAKAHHTRQRELDEGEISSAEAQKLKAQARKMDLISLGVAAVGAYNVRNGWRRAEGHWKARRERQAEERR